MPGHKQEDVAFRLGHGVASLLGHCAGPITALFSDTIQISRTRTSKLGKYSLQISSQTYIST